MQKRGNDEKFVGEVDRHFRDYGKLPIPLACSLFGIPDSVSMQVVAVGFIIGVIQDSVETRYSGLFFNKHLL